MHKIGVVGAGHVGLVTAACFASLGNRVVCVDNDSGKIEGLKSLIMPFYEPGLDDIVRDAVKKKSLHFTSSIEEAAEASEIIFIAVGTPTDVSGRADLSCVEQVTSRIASVFASPGYAASGPLPYKLIVEKSTVPVLTGEWVRKTFDLMPSSGVRVDVAANPEFLREGRAVRDFMKPDRIVVGVESERARRIFEELYSPIDAPVIFTDIKSAELIKHASNSFLAMKISYINAVSRICEKVGADIDKVAEGMGTDSRIGMDFLKAGAGYGGSCFPKDVKAFIGLASEKGYSFDLLREVEKINDEQKLIVVDKARELLWNLKEKNIAVLGLSFKPDTDDVRESPALDVISSLLREGAVVRCYDPKAGAAAGKLLQGAALCNDASSALEGASLAIFMTGWEEFRGLDFKKVKGMMKTPYIVDGRNFLDPELMAELGFVYRGIGRRTG